MDQLPLFVFGTLRRGQRNHDRYLEGRYVRVLPARLPGFARTAPLMIARCADEVVDGELYFLRGESYDAAMEEIDWLESISPGQSVGPEYRRIRVRVQTAEGESIAWVYVRPDTVE